MKCNGVKCITPITNQFNYPDFGLQLQYPGSSMPMHMPMNMPMNVPLQMNMNMQRPSSQMEIDTLIQPSLALTRPSFDNFIFRQKNRFNGNLRG
jgi:hypothetical protein